MRDRRVEVGPAVDQSSSSNSARKGEVRIARRGYAQGPASRAVHLPGRAGSERQEAASPRSRSGSSALPGDDTRRVHSRVPRHDADYCVSCAALRCLRADMPMPNGAADPRGPLAAIELCPEPFLLFLPASFDFLRFFRIAVLLALLHRADRPIRCKPEGAALERIVCPAPRRCPAQEPITRSGTGGDALGCRPRT